MYAKTYRSAPRPYGWTSTQHSPTFDEIYPIFVKGLQDHFAKSMPLTRFPFPKESKMKDNTFCGYVQGLNYSENGRYGCGARTTEVELRLTMHGHDLPHWANDRTGGKVELEIYAPGDPRPWHISKKQEQDAFDRGMRAALEAKAKEECRQGRTCGCC